MDTLESLLVFVAPDLDAQDPLDATPYVDDPVRKLVRQAADRAVRKPEAVSSGTCDTISLTVTIGSLQDTVQLKLAALPTVLIERYCAGGWASVDAFASETFTQVFNRSDPGFRWPLDASGNRIAPPPQACASAFLKQFSAAETQLESIVASSLMVIARDAWALGRARVDAVQQQLIKDKQRYQRGTEPGKGGTEGGPGGAGGAPGDIGSGGGSAQRGTVERAPSQGQESQPAGGTGGGTAGTGRASGDTESGGGSAQGETVERAPSQGQKSQPAGGTGGGTAQSGSEGGPGGGGRPANPNLSAFDDLVASMQSLVGVTNTLLAARAPITGEADAPGGAEGGPGDAAPVAARERQRQEGAAKAQQAYVDELTKVLQMPGQHLIAPALLANVFGSSTKPIPTPTADDIGKAVTDYLNEALQLVSQASPRSDVGAELERRLRGESLKSRLQSLPTSREADLRDRLELRVALWAMDMHQYVYEPLNDEWLLLQLLDGYKVSLKSAATDEDAMVFGLRYRALVGMLSARRGAQVIQQLERERDDVLVPLLSKAGAFLDLVTIRLPALSPITNRLLILVLVASAVQQIGDVPEAARRSDAATVSALLSDDYKAYFNTLATKPTIVSVCTTLVIESAVAVLGLRALEKRAPNLALTIRVLLDFDTLLWPKIKAFLEKLLASDDQEGRGP